MADEMMSVQDMANYLRLSRATIQRWCRMRWLPAAKIGKEYRIRRDDLDRWYQSRLRAGHVAPSHEFEQGTQRP